jgi:hypothetical protein
MRRWIVVIVAFALVGVATGGIVWLSNGGGSHDTAARVTSTAETPTSTTAPPVGEFTATSRDLGLRFSSPEGAVPGDAYELHTIEAPCLYNLQNTCDTTSAWTWLVGDYSGPMLWIAKRAPGTAVDFTVSASFYVPPLPTSEGLHFADGSPYTLVAVNGAPGSAGRWTDLTDAWTIDPLAGTVVRRSTTGLTVTDQCAQQRAQGSKILSWCATTDWAPGIAVTSPRTGTTVPRTFTITGNAPLNITGSGVDVAIDGDFPQPSAVSSAVAGSDGSFTISMNLSGDHVVAHREADLSLTNRGITSGLHRFHVFFDGNAAVHTHIEGPTLVLTVT